MNTTEGRKKIVILGSTGSIGENTLRVIDSFPDRFQVIGMAAGSESEDLARQALKYRPGTLAMAEAAEAAKLRGLLDEREFTVLEGEKGVAELASLEDADMVVSAIVGAPGLLPTYRAVESGVDVALANKEPLVMAGELIIAAAARTGASIIPVDSEHHALFTALQGLDKKDVDKVTITASGGPFLGWRGEDLEDVTVEQALNHPSWKMGRKITVDSATLMNKGLEIIEAHWLFGLPEERIEVLVHPQSIVHAMVHLADGGCLSYLSPPDMRLPIAAALNYPEKLDFGLERVDLPRVAELTFGSPDHENFPSITMAREALKEGGTAPSVLNAANEVAVEAFLGKRLKFTGIFEVLREVMGVHQAIPADSLETILEWDRWAREQAENLIGTK
jgi:1-deoxy-D-xylulose-5-phosphate reductoisomerase